MHSTFIAYISLLMIIVFLVMLARYLKISYPIVLVLGGLAISFIPLFSDIEIDPDYIFLIFLPPLLYDAAWQTSWKEFWRWRRVIISFAFLIVIGTSCVVAVVSSSIIPSFTLALGFLLGGIISPPDAVSATTVMKDVAVPKRMVSIVEGESMLNDASSLIVFKFALGSIQTGKFIWTEAALDFIIVIVMGCIIGLAIALVFYAIHKYLPTTPSLDIVLTFVTPYVMYIVAEQFHFSGVLAVVSGGLFLSHKQHTMLSHISRIQGVNVWTTIGFVLNGLIFILIGLQLPVITENLRSSGLSDAIKYSLVISIVLIISRLLSTFGASIFTVFISRFIKTADPRPGWKAPLVLGWAGMRGVVSLAAALSIPLYLNGAPFPHRNLILFITFVVILTTLVFQGLTLPMIIRWVDMDDPDLTMPLEQQEILLRKKMIQESLYMIDEKYKEELKTNEYLSNLRSRFETEIKDLEKPTLSNIPEEALNQSSNFLNIYKELIYAQRASLQLMNLQPEVDEDLIRKHLSMLDLEEEKLRQRFHT